MATWWYTPENTIKETISWLTDVISCRNAETRRQVRTYPRHEISCEFYLKNHAQFSAAKYYAANTEPVEVDVPWWPLWYPVSNIDSEDTVVTVFDAEDYYTIGDKVIITTGESYTEHIISAVNVDSIELTAPIGADYLEGAIVPVKTVTTMGFKFSRSEGSSIIVASATFASRYIKSSSYAAYPEYESTGIHLIDQQSETNGSMEERIAKASFVNDGDVGFVDVSDDEKYFRHYQSLQFMPMGHDDCRKIRRFLHWMKGRLNIFYIPTWIDEVESPEYVLVRSDADRIEINHTDWDSFTVNIPTVEINDTVPVVS